MRRLLMGSQLRCYIAPTAPNAYDNVVADIPPPPPEIKTYLGICDEFRTPNLDLVAWWS